MEIKTVSFIGLGALGVLFGHQMSKNMPKENLRFIADQKRIEKYKREKVYCNGEPCDFNYITPDEVQEPADLIIFSVKNEGLKDAVQAVKNQVGPNTIMISLLNGIKSEEVIGQTYGMDKILYCVAQGMDAVKVGNQLTYDHMGKLCIGERESGYTSDRLKTICNFFENVKISYEAVSDIYKHLWGKFMLNVGVNQTVAIYGNDYSSVLKEGKYRDIMIAAMREVMALSVSEGVPLTEEDLNYWLSVIGKLSHRGKPSMRQDVEAKRYSELDLFAGTVIELGKKHGIPTPVNQDLYNKMKEIESAY